MVNKSYMSMKEKSAGYIRIKYFVSLHFGQIKHTMQASFSIFIFQGQV